jgi:ABC-type multidrug transport system fused ATPase/permease subunit
MPVLREVIDVLTMKSDRPLRRLVAYYVILAIIVAVAAFFFPATIARIAAKGLGDIPEGPTVLTDALSAPSSLGTFGLASLLSVAITTVLILIGALVLMLPVTWVYMSARPSGGQHNQNVVQTLIFLPLVVAGIVFMVQNSLALAFSLAGVVGAVRFRTTLRDSRDLVYIFLSIVVGFAAGVQSLAVGAVVSIIFNFVLLITWHYDYGRNMLMPTAAAQWSRPLQALASPTGDHQVPDRDLLLSLTPEKANALADRFNRVRTAMGKKKKARYNSVLTITTDDVSEAQSRVEQVLDKTTKRWDLDEVVTNVGKPSELYYLMRLRKSIPRDVLLTAIHENAGDAIASADLETGELAEGKSADKG